ncbi:hypothetical protein HYU11_05575 [Candidatus Woesearchaeota archaeon]|nr:hypothetical protein [Candidatus Woesearchaeota archaeon]
MADLISDLRKCRNETSQLKTEMNKLVSEKEELFEKANLLKKEIASAIEKIRKSRSDRDSLTSSVKAKKIALNQETEALKELIEKRNSLIKGSKLKLKSSPSQLKTEIERMENRIETEAISFAEEQKVMKLLKQKKRQLESINTLINTNNEISLTNGKIKESRDLTRSLKGEIIREAEESQAHHEQMMASIKALSELKGKKREFTEKGTEAKKMFSETSKRLNEKLLELSDIKSRMDTQDKHERKESQEKTERMLEAKEAELKDKIMKGKKLTTKDLLFFQAT